MVERPRPSDGVFYGWDTGKSTNGVRMGAYMYFKNIKYPHPKKYSEKSNSLIGSRERALGTWT